ncbi:MAG: bifunctional metallophosphatase/5'-nucleotidase [Bacteroidota bacterium]
MSRRSLLLIFLSLFVFLQCTAPKMAPAPAAAPNAAETTVEFIILQLNDVYEIAPLEGGKAGGLARVATVRQELLRENPNVVTMLAGDFLSPSFLGTMKTPNEAGEMERIAGQQMVETLNVMGLDYATFGNHEFDVKSLELLEKRLGQSEFKYTVCNAKAVVDGRERAFRQGDGPVPEYLVHEIPVAGAAPLRLGILGVVLPFTQVDYVAYADVTSSFRKSLGRLREVSDLTVALTHQNMDEDIALAKAVPGVPLFIGGHEHVELNRYVENTIIAKADANAKTVYVHRVSYSPACGVTSIRSTVRKIDDSIPDEPATKAVVDKWFGKAFKVMKDLGYTPEREVLQLSEPLVCKESLIRTSQTNFGQLTMDAIAAALPGADAYFINSGTMRLDDYLSNIVTEYDILRTYPFGGKMVRVTLPGDVLQETLETGLKTNYGEGGYLQCKNVKFDDLSLNGTAIDPVKAYEVVLPEFVAKGYEANLEFLGEHYSGENEDVLKIGETMVNNDIRDIVIHHMLQLKNF